MSCYGNSMGTSATQALLHADDASAGKAVAELRWPGGVTCPRCGAGKPSDRPKANAWRCRSCRADFTVTSGTAMHATKVGIARWLAAAHMDDLHPPVLAEALGISVPAARRISTALRETGEPPGDSRMVSLVRCPPGPTTVLANRLPSTFDPAASPIAGLSKGQRSVLAVLRGRIRGTTVRQVAAESGLSVGHCRRCLNALAERGYVRSELTKVPWGYGSLKIHIWSLELTADCIAAMPFLPRTHRRYDHSCPERVPPEFWRLFWSGASAGDLRLPEHADFVAGSLLDSADAVARAWALRCLPVESLWKCRGMRGYSTGPIAKKIDIALACRTDA